MSTSPSRAAAASSRSEPGRGPMQTATTLPNSTFPDTLGKPRGTHALRRSHHARPSRRTLDHGSGLSHIPGMSHGSQPHTAHVRLSPARGTNLAVVLLLAAAALGVGCERGPSVAAGEQRIDYCVNRVCPITGEVLNDRTMAVHFRGYTIGVHGHDAARAWGELPEGVQQEMLRDLTEHAARWQN